MFRFCLLASCFLLVSPGCAQPVETASADTIGFRKHVLTRDFEAEGVAVGDVEGDGDLDVLYGSHWFEAPSWVPHAFREPRTFSVDSGWSDAFLLHAMDVNADARIDLVRVGFPGEAVAWYENPGTREGYWTEHAILANVGNESPGFVDVEGDGLSDLLLGDHASREMIWLRAPGAGSSEWTRHRIAAAEAPGTDRFSHGLGLGDVNGDGRADVIITEGWWEAPADPATPDWTFHPADLGPDAAQMHVFDFDRDGDADVLTTSAHDYGIWWHEQRADGTWRRHTIHDGFSQTHAAAFADVDGDGLPDLVTGKRYFAHLGKDPGGLEPAVLYWFRLSHDRNGRPTWTPFQIDDNSGVGLNLVVRDVTGDGLVDIVTGNKKGAFVFEQIRR